MLPATPVSERDSEEPDAIPQNSPAFPIPAQRVPENSRRFPILRVARCTGMHPDAPRRTRMHPHAAHLEKRTHRGASDPPLLRLRFKSENCPVR